MEGKASEPTAWPSPFNAGDNGKLPLIELGGGHMVRAQSSANLGVAAE